MPRIWPCLIAAASLAVVSAMAGGAELDRPNMPPPGAGRANEPPDDLGIPRHGRPLTTFPAARTGPVTESEAADGLREILRMGVERAVRQLGAADGFGRDRFVGVPLPASLEGREGDAQALDALKQNLNHAAETATADAAPVFEDGIRALALNDASRLVAGPRTSATDRLRQQMTGRLLSELRPGVEAALKSNGAVAAYERLAPGGGAEGPDAGDALTDHVLNRTVAGLFHYIAQQEAAVRTNPAARTTPLLQRVFAEPAKLNDPSDVRNPPPTLQPR